MPVYSLDWSDADRCLPVSQFQKPSGKQPSESDSSLAHCPCQSCNAGFCMKTRGKPEPDKTKLAAAYVLSR